MRTLTKARVRVAVAANLKRFMAAKGMNQTTLASAVGLRDSSVSDYISGRIVPGLVAAMQLADALEVTVDELGRDHRGKNSRRPA